MDKEAKKILKELQAKTDALKAEKSTERKKKIRVNNLFYIVLMLLMLVPVALEATTNRVINSISLIMWINLVRMLTNMLEWKNYELFMTRAIHNFADESRMQFLGTQIKAEK